MEIPTKHWKAPPSTRHLDYSHQPFAAHSQFAASCARQLWGALYSRGACRFPRKAKKTRNMLARSLVKPRATPGRKPNMLRILHQLCTIMQPPSLCLRCGQKFGRCLAEFQSDTSSSTHQACRVHGSFKSSMQRSTTPNLPKEQLGIPCGHVLAPWWTSSNCLASPF